MLSTYCVMIGGVTASDRGTLGGPRSSAALLSRCYDGQVPKKASDRQTRKTLQPVEP